MYQYSLQQKAPTSQVWKLLHTRTALDIFFLFIHYAMRARLFKRVPIHELKMSSSHETDFALAKLKLVYAMITLKKNLWNSKEKSITKKLTIRIADVCTMNNNFYWKTFILNNWLLQISEYIHIFDIKFVSFNFTIL